MYSLSVAGHLDCFRILTIANNVRMSMRADRHISSRSPSYFLSVYTQNSTYILRKKNWRKDFSIIFILISHFFCSPMMSVPLAEKDQTSRNESVVDRGVHDMLPGPLFHIIILDKWKVSCIQRNVSQGALSCLSGTETPRTITICVWSLILWDRALLKIQYSHVNTPSVSSSGSPPSKTAYLARGFGFQEPHLISHFFICMFCNFFFRVC